ncbi:MAG: SCO family protein [Pseudomonadota bacterium]
MLKANRKISIIISGLVILLSVIFYIVILRPQQFYYNAHHVSVNGTYLLKPLPIEDFEVIDNHNHSFTKANLKNHWTMLFFGFTHCEMVCPTTLSALNQMYKILEKSLPEAKLPQVVFITVDPDRDTIEKLNEYVTSFNPDFKAGRATTEKTIALEKQFNIVSTTQQVNGSYTINHSPDILLINPDAKIQAYLSYPHHQEALVKDYNSIISK